MRAARAHLKQAGSRGANGNWGEGGRAEQKVKKNKTKNKETFIRKTSKRTNQDRQAKRNEFRGKGEKGEQGGTLHKKRKSKRAGLRGDGGDGKNRSRTKAPGKGGHWNFGSEKGRQDGFPHQGWGGGQKSMARSTKTRARTMPGSQEGRTTGGKEIN